MVKNFTQSVMKAAALSAIILGAAYTANAQDKLYLADVYTEAELNADIFGVPMRIDNVEGSKYVAHYYNQKANNEVYILANKTNFSEVYGDDFDGAGNLSMGGSIDEVAPIVLPEAGKYYAINLDIDEMTYEVATYEVAENMDPLFWQLGSENLNVWFNYVDSGTDDWQPAEDAWVRTFYFGYTCTEYLINDNNEYVDQAGNVVMYDKDAGIDERVMATKLNPLGEEVGAEQLRWCEPWAVDANNPHLFTWTSPKHFVAGQKLNFIIHNWHEAGWWNFVTWRVDDEEECDIFYYYGGVVKQAYLDWAFPGKGLNWKNWKDDEGYRRTAIFGEGSDAWCKPTVKETGEYVLQFDSHLGRAKLVPAGSIDIPNNGVQAIESNDNAPIEYFNLQGVRVNNPENGIYIKRQGNKATKVLVK